MMKKLNVKRTITNNSALFVFLLLFIASWIVYGEKLGSPSVVINLFTQSSIMGLVAIGMTCVILTGSIDLSVGSIVGISGVFAALLSTGNVLLVILISVITGFAIGMLNGFLVTKMKIVPFISTLSTMIGVRGIIFIITNNKSVSASDSTQAFQFIAKWDMSGLNSALQGADPTPATTKAVGLVTSSLEKLPLFLYFIVAVVLLMIVLKYTRFGRSIYAVGGNIEAAKMMGINTGRIIRYAYAISGLLSAIAGLVLCSRLRAGQHVAGEGWEMSAIAATVIGGTLLTGGKGTVGGTFFGVLIIELIKQIFIMQGNINVWWQNIATGAILLMVVMLQARTQFKKGKI